MPHKRAKASIRKAESLRKGYDLPPNQDANKKKKKRKEKHNSFEKAYEIGEDIPKNMFRILNAEKIRADYKLKKNQNNGSLATSKPSTSNNQRSNPGSQRGSNNTTSSTKRRNNSTQCPKDRDELKIMPGEGLGSFNRSVFVDG